MIQVCQRQDGSCLPLQQLLLLLCSTIFWGNKPQGQPGGTKTLHS